MSVTIPDSVTTIGREAFRRCMSLSSVTIGNSVTTIGGSAFLGCTSLTYTEYESGKYLGNAQNLYVVLVDVDQSVTSFTIPNTTRVIYESALKDCTNLTSVTIPDSVTTIDVNAFRNCTSLTTVTIGNSVTSIGSSAFYKCTSLTTVTIPDSVTSIGDSAFYNCTSLTKVNITDIAAWCNISFGDLDANPLTYAHNLYINNELVTNLHIPDRVTSIGDFTFSDCTRLTSVTIPDSVTTIGDDAFSGCTSLTSVTIPDSVTTIGDDAFYNCTSLTYTEYENGKYLGNAQNPYVVLVFADQSVTSFTIPNTTRVIYGSAFYWCNSLTSVTIGNSVTTIGRYAFSGCTSLTNITFNGTKAQWNAIDKDYDWDMDTATTPSTVRTATFQSK